MFRVVTNDNRGNAGIQNDALTHHAVVQSPLNCSVGRGNASHIERRTEHLVARRGNNGILFGMDGTAKLVPLPTGDIQLVAETISEIVAVFPSARCTVIARRHDHIILNNDRAELASEAGTALGNRLRNIQIIIFLGNSLHTHPPYGALHHYPILHYNLLFLRNQELFINFSHRHILPSVFIRYIEIHSEGDTRMSNHDSAPRSLAISVCERSVSGEITTEYSMPDYEPEVRRLLRVNAVILPPSSYVGSGTASFSGNVRFDILYSSPDGELCRTSTTEGFELSAPLEKDADIDYSDEILAFCDVQPESMVSRVTAPRKMTLRCRLRARIRAYGHSMPVEKLTGDFDPAGIERRCGVADCASFAHAVSEIFDVSDDTEPTRQGELRVIGGEGTVQVSEAQATDGMVSCRGDVILRILVQSGDTSPYVLTSKLPFAENVEGDGFESGMACCAWGQVCEITAEAADGRVHVGASFQLCADAQENLPIPYTRDLYSAVREVTSTFGKVEFPHAVACRTGNFTQSLYEPPEHFDIPADAEILDFSAHATVDSALCERGKWALVGETRMNLLFLTEGEYRTQEIPIPFRYEFDGECGEVESLFADVHMIGGRARMDGGRLAIDCEMGISFRLCVARDATVLREATFGAEVPQNDECVICFPTKGDTLWEIAKRYHAPLSRLRALNHLDSDDALGEYVIIHS